MSESTDEDLTEEEKAEQKNEAPKEQFHRAEAESERKALKLSISKEGIKSFYNNHYKKLILIPIIILILAFVQIGIQTATTGDFINKGISLKGGISVTVPTEDDVNIGDLQGKLSAEFPGKDINVRVLESLGSRIGVVIEADVDENNHEEFNAFIDSIGENMGLGMTAEDYSVEFFGSSLGQNFFRETSIAILIAFLFMAIVVFFYFRTLVPSGAVVLAAFSDIIITIAVVNILGVKISTAGIAGFLMLIGYSVDTDILLSTRVLKRKEGSILQRMFGAMKTGMMMTLTTLVAVSIAYVFSESDVLHQIMMIIIIGLIVDLMNTWILNAGILKLYMEKKISK